MQAPKDSKAYKNSINGVGKMVHRYSFTQVKPVLCIRDVIPDPIFLSRIRIFSIPDPGSTSKKLSILTLRNGF
jgi:hypothetical protein